MEALKPTYHYNSSLIRHQWKTIRSILERHKISTVGGPADIVGEIDQTTIGLANRAGSSNAVPVLIATTFHPNWRRNDGGIVYAATPFYMLTFLQQPITLSYQRTSLDRSGMYLSGIVAFLCLLAAILYAARSLARFKRFKMISFNCNIRLQKLKDSWVLVREMV